MCNSSIFLKCTSSMCVGSGKISSFFAKFVIAVLLIASSSTCSLEIKYL